MCWIIPFVLSFTAQVDTVEPLISYETRLDAAAKHYDTGGAIALADELRVRRDSARDRDTALLLARTLLLVADLRRTQYELTPERDSVGRRAHGQAIDKAATEALELLKAMGDTSEVWRMRADLYGTMIRSDYRATRFRKRMEEAISRALALDAANPRAHVSAARPLVFAAPGQGQDLDAAIRQIDAALSLDSKLESARVLKAVTFEKLGRVDEAMALWRAVLEDNADCLPARRRLDEFTGL